MMGKLLTIILFFIYLYGLGYALTRNMRGDRLERLIVRLGAGLGAFPVLGLCLNHAGVPLDWRIFLGLSLLVPAVDVVRSVRSDGCRALLQRTGRWWPFRWRSCDSPGRDAHTGGGPGPQARVPGSAILLLAIFLTAVVIYCGGPFTYPWLEDTDSWFHAAGIKYVAVEKNVNVPAATFQYILPYPPGYDLLFGVLHQTSASLYWTLKFFNGLIIVLGYLFFFLFVRGFTSERKALLATFFLLCIPCYLSHFIWAHALVVTLFFPALYLTFRAGQDRRFLPAAVVVTAAIFLVQPTQALKYGCLAFFFFGASFADPALRKRNILIAILAGVAVSALLWWAPVAVKMAGQDTGFAFPDNTTAAGLQRDQVSAMDRVRSLLRPTGGSATRSYTLEDYIGTPAENQINNPVGVGMILSALALLGLVSTLWHVRRYQGKERVFAITMLLWLLFTFLGMNSQTFQLPVGLFAFRFWMLFAVPAVYFAAEGGMLILSRSPSPPVTRLTLVILLFAVGMTAGMYTVRINSFRWWSGEFWEARSEMKGYVWLREHLEPDTKVFAYINSFLLLGFDMSNDFWRETYKTDLADLFGQDLDETNARLEEYDYQYLIVGDRERMFFGDAAFEDKIRALQDDPRFTEIYRKNSMVWIFRLDGQE